MQWWDGGTIDPARISEGGFDPGEQRVSLLMALAGVFSAILAVHCFWDRRKTKKPA